MSTPHEQLIAAFRALCDREGGPVKVAEEIDASDDYLKQIYAGTKLPKGNPRGVGRQMQAKLEKRYPGWAQVPTARTLHEPRPAYTITSVRHTVQAFADAVGRAPIARRAELLKVLELLVAYPSETDYATRLAKLLEHDGSTHSKPKLARR